jgi:hypothetical protein
MCSSAPFKLLLYGQDTIECAYYLQGGRGQGGRVRERLRSVRERRRVKWAVEPEFKGLLEGMALRIDIEAERSLEKGSVETGSVVGRGEVLDGADGLTHRAGEFVGGSQQGAQSGTEFGRRKSLVEEPVAGRAEVESAEELGEERAVELGEEGRVCEELSRGHNVSFLGEW